MGESAVEHKTNQGIRVDDKSTGEEVANSEKQSKKVSIAEAEPPSSPTIIDLSTADVVLDKVGSSECHIVVLSLTTVIEKQVNLLAPLLERYL